MKTDEEINRFFLKGRIKDKIWLGSLPNHLQELQHRVIQAHTELDVDMLVRILSQIRYEAGDVLSNEAWEIINPVIQQSLDAIPYMSKLSIIKSYGDISDKLERALIKVNAYRNEFAHPRTDFLLEKYNIKTSKGKVGLRDLTRAIERAEDLFLDHTQNSEACRFYVKKQMEIIEERKKKVKVASS